MVQRDLWSRQSRILQTNLTFGLNSAWTRSEPLKPNPCGRTVRAKEGSAAARDDGYPSVRGQRNTPPLRMGARQASVIALL